MNKTIFFVAVVLLSLLQVSLLEYAKVLGAKPDTLFAAAIIAGLSLEPGWALAAAIFCGLLKDAFGTGPAFLNTAVFTLWALAVIQLIRKITVENRLIASAFVLIAATANCLFVRFLSYAFSGIVLSMGTLVRTAFLESLYTAAATLLLLKLAGPVVELRR